MLHIIKLCTPLTYLIYLIGMCITIMYYDKRNCTVILYCEELVLLFNVYLSCVYCCKVKFGTCPYTIFPLFLVSKCLAVISRFKHTRLFSKSAVFTDLIVWWYKKSNSLKGTCIYKLLTTQDTKHEYLSARIYIKLIYMNCILEVILWRAYAIAS